MQLIRRYLNSNILIAFSYNIILMMTFLFGYSIWLKDVVRIKDTNGLYREALTAHYY